MEYNFSSRRRSCHRKPISPGAFCLSLVLHPLHVPSPPHGTPRSPRASLVSLHRRSKNNIPKSLGARARQEVKTACRNESVKVFAPLVGWKCWLESGRERERNGECDNVRAKQKTHKATTASTRDRVTPPPPNKTLRISNG